MFARREMGVWFTDAHGRLAYRSHNIIRDFTGSEDYWRRIGVRKRLAKLAGWKPGMRWNTFPNRRVIAGDSLLKVRSLSGPRAH